MRIDRTMDAITIVSEISKRFRQYRIAYPMTQAELADKSMVSLSTIKRFESGEDISLSKLLMLIESLDLQENVELLIPDQSIRPSAFLEESKPKQRARHRTARKPQWKWKDEE